MWLKASKCVILQTEFAELYAFLESHFWRLPWDWWSWTQSAMRAIAAFVVSVQAEEIGVHSSAQHGWLLAVTEKLKNIGAFRELFFRKTFEFNQATSTCTSIRHPFAANIVQRVGAGCVQTRLILYNLVSVVRLCNARFCFLCRITTGLMTCVLWGARVSSILESTLRHIRDSLVVM